MDGLCIMVSDSLQPTVIISLVFLCASIIEAIWLRDYLACLHVPK